MVSCGPTFQATPLCLAVEPCPSQSNPRLPDPGDVRQIVAVRTLLRLGATPDPVDDEAGGVTGCL